METIRLDDWVEQIPEAVSVLNTDDRVLRISKEFTRLFGYEPDEVVGRPINELIVPEKLIESARDYTRQLQRAQRVEVETVRRRKDGTDVEVSLLAVPVTTASGDHVANYATYRDITKRKRAEERLLESEARFRTMADKAPVLIWTTGTDGLCDYFSKPWLEFTGRTMEQEVGTGWVEGVHPDDVKGCFDYYWPAFQARKPFRMEYRLRRADGKYRWLIESGVPRYTGAGEFAGYIGSNIDVTDLKWARDELSATVRELRRTNTMLQTEMIERERTEEALQEARAELAHTARVATLGELTASIAHEVSQPLVGVVTSGNACLRWLDVEPPNVEAARRSVERIVRDGHRAAEVLERIRALVKKAPPKEEQVEVNKIISEIIALTRTELQHNGVSVRTELANDLPPVLGDRIQLQQVILNLIINAIEAMTGEGAGPRELLVVSGKDGPNGVLVAVHDSGTGLSEENIDRLFGAFYTTKSKGMGMGLAISRTIIEAHGGRLWATPNTLRGAIFQFRLPIGREAAPSLKQARLPS
jgi:PAS domain S-box-containing protein